MQPLQLGLYLLHLNLKNRSYLTVTVSESETFLVTLVLFCTAPPGAGAPPPAQKPAEIIQLLCAVSLCMAAQRTEGNGHTHFQTGY